MFWDWWQKVEWLQVGGVILKILIVVVAASLLLKLVRKLLGRILERNNRLADNRRTATMSSLLYSIGKYVVYFIAGMVVLSLLGINIGPVLASAGVLGLAVGFGAQNLVKDTISGFFIIFDNYFSVGDYITTGGVSGFVEEIGLRTTKIRDWGGEVHVFPNGNINLVTNFSQGNLCTYVDIPIGYEHSYGLVLPVIEATCQQLAQDFPCIIEGPKVLGVDKLAADRMLIKLCFTASLDDKFTVERELNRRVKEDLAQAGIELPRGYQVVSLTEKRQERGAG